MRAKAIPIRIEWIAGEEGGGSPEIVMELRDFESSGTSIRASVRKFRDAYMKAIAKAKEIDVASPAEGRRRASTKQRWRTCKLLADFDGKFTSKFEVTNYKAAYARDFGLPSGSIGAYLDFGRNFGARDVLDKIPYSTYAELVSRVDELRSRGLFEPEKKKLVEMGKNGTPPSRDEYRRRLSNLLARKNARSRKLDDTWA